MSRLWAIPDIHGRDDLLQLLWDKLETEEGLDLKKDKVIFLGDYVDRGPDSYHVVHFIKSLVEGYPDNVKAVVGNHEDINVMYMVRRLPDDVWSFEANGGLKTRDSYHRQGFMGMIESHVKFLAGLPTHIEEDGFFFSHAPAPRESYRNILNKGQEFTREELTWTYNRDECGVARVHDNGVIGVCGHVHALGQGKMEPRFYDHYYYLDSGCGCSAKAPLVAVDVKTKKTIFAWPHELVDKDKEVK